VRRRRSTIRKGCGCGGDERAALPYALAVADGGGHAILEPERRPELSGSGIVGPLVHAFAGSDDQRRLTGRGVVLPEVVRGLAERRGVHRRAALLYHRCLVVTDR